MSWLDWFKPRKAAKKKDDGKQLSPAFVTGSGGARFENQVQTAFSLLMLSGGACPYLRRPIKQVMLQGRNAGFHTDDLIVFVEDKNEANRARLLAQVKHKISVNMADRAFADSIGAAWRDFSTPENFDREVDIIALITGPLSATDIDDVRPLLRSARQSDTAVTFMRQMALAQFTSDGQRGKLQVFRKKLEAEKGSALTDDELWAFLRRFHLMGFDFDDEAGTSLSLLESHIAQYKADGFSFVWDRISGVVGSANQAATILTKDSFPAEVSDIFAPPKAPLMMPEELLKTAVAPVPPSAPAALSGDEGSALMIASLLGSWSDKNDGDMDAARKLIE